MTGHISEFERKADQTPRIPTSRPCVGEAELAALASVLESRWLGTGSLTQQFESELSQHLDVRHVIAVNSGTAAIHIALEALGIGEGDEVIVPSLTFVSTIQAIIAAGARPVFCEVDPEDAQIDVEDACSRVSKRTRAVLPVHYGGASPDMDTLLDRCNERGLWVVADAAHAFGSSCRGRNVGTLADIACFSFDPIKNITCGGGGAAVTSDGGLAEKLRLLCNVGMEENSWTRLVTRSRGELTVKSKGYRYRMLDLNAAIGLSQLRRASDFRASKLAIVRRYDEAFRDFPGVRLLKRQWEETFPFSYVFRVVDDKQAALAEHLRAAGIGTTVHFMPNHLHQAFSEYKTSLPVTEMLYGQLLTLPLYVELSDSDLDWVIGQVAGFFEGRPPGKLP